MFQLNQLVMGYQNGNIEDLLISYNNFLSKNLTFLSGENVDLFFGFMDDSCNLVESIFSSHSHSLEVDLTTVMKMSFGIFSHLLRHFSSIDSTQVLSKHLPQFTLLTQIIKLEEKLPNFLHLCPYLRNKKKKAQPRYHVLLYINIECSSLWFYYLYVFYTNIM